MATLARLGVALAILEIEQAGGALGCNRRDGSRQFADHGHWRGAGI
jgi:hypothetical protein